MKTLAIILSIIVLIYLIITYIMFILVCRKTKKDFLPMDKAVDETLKPYQKLIKEGNKWIESKYKNKEIEDVFIKSRDYLNLHAIFIENKKSKGIFIEMHGYRSTAIRDLYPSCFHYYNMGYSLLIIDHRTSNLSEGKYITFGMKGSEDLLCWIKYLNKKYPKKDIILAGVSMGASTMLMSMNRIKENMNVKKVIADCGYISAYKEVKYCIDHYFHIPGSLFVGMINIWCKLIAGFDLNGKNTIRSMKNSHIPVLLIHGDEDDFVPPFNSKINYKKYNGPKELLIFEGASHGISYLVYPEKYVKCVKEFLAKGDV